MSTHSAEPLVGGPKHTIPSGRCTPPYLNQYPGGWAAAFDMWDGLVVSKGLGVADGWG
jgi:hypothetical protein